MESSETDPKDFVSAAQILPLDTPGISNLAKFREIEQEKQNLENLKRWGLTDDEIQLYQDNEKGLERFKMEQSVLQEKLEYIYNKLKVARQCELESFATVPEECEASTSANTSRSFSDTNVQTYPPGHPMNYIKQLENDLFGHIQNDDIAPINKRRKILRRLHRKQDSLEHSHLKVGVKDVAVNTNGNPNSLWDLRDIPKRPNVSGLNASQSLQNDPSKLIGPMPQSHYTIRDSKIVRLEPLINDGPEQNYRAVDIVVPVNEAEQRLLEGTKLSVDDIRSMERFKNYEPGKPSKVLFLKNISPQASREDVSILFNQFIHENGAPINVRIMTGRLRGQAFVHFQSENVAIQALEDVNGTVVKGRPVIVQFGKNSNNIQYVQR